MVKAIGQEEVQMKFEDNESIGELAPPRTYLGKLVKLGVSSFGGNSRGSMPPVITKDGFVEYVCASGG